MFWIPACAGMTNATKRHIFARHSRASGNPGKKNQVLNEHEGSSMVSAQHPTFDKKGHPVTMRQQIPADLFSGAYDFVGVSERGHAFIAFPTIRANDRPRVHGIPRRLSDALRRCLWNARQPDSVYTPPSHCAAISTRPFPAAPRPRLPVFTPPEAFPN